jgi:hydroxymethylglutaryl-CoA lyase
MATLGTIAIRDVTLRDGLQDEDPIPTEAKLTLYDALVAAGIGELELTSFVRPDRVPALADAEAMVRATEGGGGPVRWGLVLNRRGAERALAAGLRHLQFVFSVSEAHNKENAGRTVDASIGELGQIVEVAHDAGATVEATLATAFGCPFTGPVPPADVVAAAERVVAVDVDGLSVADTIGTAIPAEVSRVVGQVVERAGDRPVGVHLHDTRGLALANALAAIDVGARRLDGSVGGLGGCPFAPGASGNIALEDLVHALDASGIDTGIDLERLLAAAALACELVGRPLATHLGVAGPRFAGLAPVRTP